jgi:hypothetical protein
VPAATTIPITKVRKLQARYLRALVEKSGCQLQQVVDASRFLSFVKGRPDLAFGPKSFSGWLAGTHNPTTAHRYALAAIFGVPFDEFNEEIDGAIDWNKVELPFTSVIAVVPGKHRNFVYHLCIWNRKTNLARPAIYHHWTHMFARAAPLVRHFRHLKHRLYGWIPEINSPPMNRYSSTLVALSNAPDSTLETLDSPSNLCFVRLTGGDRSVKVGLREGRCLLLPDPAQPKVEFHNTELLGYLTSEPLLTLYPFSVERLEALVAFHEQPSFGSDKYAGV